MRLKAIIFALLSVLVMAACGVEKPPPLLGIAANEYQQVIDIEPNSPALEAGVQVGDILLDLTWFNFSYNVGIRDRQIDKSPIPFTDRERIKLLMDNEYLLRLRVKRDNQVIELIIQPTIPLWRKFGEPTATPLWPPNDLF